MVLSLPLPPSISFPFSYQGHHFYLVPCAVFQNFFIQLIMCLFLPFITHTVDKDLYLAFLINIITKFNNKLHKGPLGNGMILKSDQIYTDKQQCSSNKIVQNSIKLQVSKYKKLISFIPKSSFHLSSIHLLTIWKLLSIL